MLSGQNKKTKSQTTLAKKEIPTKKLHCSQVHTAQSLVWLESRLVDISTVPSCSLKLQELSKPWYSPRWWILEAFGKASDLPNPPTTQKPMKICENRLRAFHSFPLTRRKSLLPFPRRFSLAWGFGCCGGFGCLFYLTTSSSLEVKTPVAVDQEKNKQLNSTATATATATTTMSTTTHICLRLLEVSNHFSMISMISMTDQTPRSAPCLSKVELVRWLFRSPQAPQTEALPEDLQSSLRSLVYGGVLLPGFPGWGVVVGWF